MAEHGTYARHNHGGCRCDGCVAAAIEYGRKRRVERKTAVAEGSADVPHGASGYTNWGCRCDLCIEASRNLNARRREKDPERVRWKANHKFARGQEATRPTASRSRQQWTGPELEMAARGDLTARQVALMTGRTYAAVQNMRKRLRDDPKTINLAGIEPSVADR